MAELLPYDIELVEQLNRKPGIAAESVIWESSFDTLHNFDAAIFRTTWGYHENIVHFREFLNYLDTLDIKVLNPTTIIRDNLDKSYLRSISEKGVNIIPTIYIDKDSVVDLGSIILERKWKQFILKPQISAGSYNTYLHSADNINAAQSDFAELVKSGGIMLQEFRKEVKTEGEFSTIFFNRNTHYTINKVPKSDDYRVQFQYGGIYKRVEPNETIMRRTLDAAELFIDSCLYVRVDGLFYDNDFHIMEVELIEPDLYLNLVPEFIPALASEIVKRLS
jgi:glutathione synthase/RimK-type ligase-like ATP-grasp enzyme